MASTNSDLPDYVKAFNFHIPKRSLTSHQKLLRKKIMEELFQIATGFVPGEKKEDKAYDFKGTKKSKLSKQQRTDREFILAKAFVNLCNKYLQIIFCDVCHTQANPLETILI